MQRRLSLEQRTERLVQRSQALLRPRPRGPERAKPLLGPALCSSTLDDPLVQWRSRRCRWEEPALDTPLAGSTLLDSAASQGALQRVPRGDGSRDSPGALHGAEPWESPEPSEAPRPIRKRFGKQQRCSSPRAVSQAPLWQEPCCRSYDSHNILWPVRSSSLDTLQGAGYSHSRDSHEALWQISRRCCASAHQRMPPCGKQESREPLRHEPFWGSRDCLRALQCAPYQKPCDSQNALRPAREVRPEPLHQGAPGLRSRDPCTAPQPMRSSARDALTGAPLQHPLGPLGDPFLWMLRCHRQAITGRLRAIETLLECPPGRPQPRVGPIKQ